MVYHDGEGVVIVNRTWEMWTAAHNKTQRIQMRAHIQICLAMYHSYMCAAQPRACICSTEAEREEKTGERKQEHGLTGHRSRRGGGGGARSLIVMPLGIGNISGACFSISSNQPGAPACTTSCCAISN